MLKGRLSLKLSKRDAFQIIGLLVMTLFFGFAEIRSHTRDVSEVSGELSSYECRSKGINRGYVHSVDLATGEEYWFSSSRVACYSLNSFPVEGDPVQLKIKLPAQVLSMRQNGKSIFPDELMSRAAVDARMTVRFAFGISLLMLVFMLYMRWDEIKALKSKFKRWSK